MNIVEDRTKNGNGILTLDEKKEAGERCRLAALDFLRRGWPPLALCPPDHIGVGKKHLDNCGSPGKRPWHDWKKYQTQRPTEADINRLWRQNCQSNVGIVLGEASRLIRVDVDGETGNRLLEEVSGGDLPETLEFTSGQPGSRGLLYEAPEEVKLRTTTATGEGDHDELRFQANGAQTVLPPSRHEKGTTYEWIDGHSPDDIPLAPAPDWVIEEVRVQEKKSAGNETASQPTAKDRELALLALAALSDEHADDYDTFYKVGMILHLVDSSNGMLAEWIEWSRKSTKFKDGECESKWESFGVDDDRDTVGIGSLIYWAQQDGWTLPRNFIDTAQTELTLELLQITLDTDGGVGLFQNRTLLQQLANVSTNDHAGYARAKQLVKTAKVGIRDFEKVVKQLVRQKDTDFSQEDAGYFVSDEGVICRRKATPDGPVPLPLCNFAARIAEQVVYDDGVESRIMFTVEGELFDGTPLKTVTITADEFAGLNWVLREWRTRPIIYAGAGTKDHLRVALQFLSGNVLHKTVYRHTGWRKIEGRHYYLHSGGAVGPQGPVGPVTVELSGSLKNYIFEEPKRPVSLRDAIRASLVMLKLAPGHISFPILCSVYRSVLKECDFSVWISGRTGCFKSEFAALAQQYFGLNFVRTNLLAAWSSTANYLAACSFTVQDGLLVIDDFCPTGPTTDIARSHKDADRVLRGQGNNSGRGRCRPDGTPKPDKPPRGLIMVTGEDAPRGHSLRARTLFIEISPGDVDVGVLTACQKDAADGLYQFTMREYLQWLAPQYEEVLDEFNANVKEVRDNFRTTMKSDQHNRLPGVVAELSLAFELFLRFAVEAGAVTEEEKTSYQAKCWEALVEASDSQETHQRDADPTSFFVRMLQAALAATFYIFTRTPYVPQKLAQLAQLARKWTNPLKNGPLLWAS